MLAWSANPCVVNPLIANKSRRKTDKLDAKMLALQGMMGMWLRSVIPTEQQEAARLTVRHRLRLVRERTRLTNQMNNTVLHIRQLKSHGPAAALTSQTEAAKALTAIYRGDSPTHQTGGLKDTRRARRVPSKQALTLGPTQLPGLVAHGAALHASRAALAANRNGRDTRVA